MSTIDRAFFERSEYNTLINNVSGGLVSNVYKKINPYQVGVSESVEMHDDLQTDPKYTRIRFEGSKVSSAKYNVYTSASRFNVGLENIDWKGDSSYGKTAAIDYTVNKFAFANSINSTNLNFYDKTTMNIKYLIDATGSVIELSANNRNLFEVQSTYKKGEIAYISLFDRYNPTNQAILDGPKIIFEGGFRYSPIAYREVDENLVFTYIVPNETVDNRFGLKAVNTTASVWQTAGNTNAEFSSNSGTGYTFTLKGVSDPNNKAMSLTKISSNSWPYSYIPVSNWLSGVYRDYQNNRLRLTDLLFDYNTAPPHYYAIDWFVPVDTTTANGGYISANQGGTINEVKAGSENYCYYLAPRNATYTVNIDIPVKVYAVNPERASELSIDKGPAVVKIVAVLEVQKSGTSTWEYLYTPPPNEPARTVPYGYTKMSATNIPIPLGGSSRWGTTRALVNEEDSFIFFAGNTQAGFYNGRNITSFYEVRCQLFDRDIKLNQNDKLRVRFYFAEATSFFRRSENIYFEIGAGDSSRNYFEVYDKDTADVSVVSTKTLTQTPSFFNTSNDNQSLIFSSEASLLYSSSIFEPQDLNNPNSTANLYSPIELPFTFEVNDIVRFTRFNSIKAEYYYITEVVNPFIENIGTQRTVTTPLTLRLDRTYNPNLVKSSTFAFFRKLPDETVIMLDFKKRPGLSSNALILPHNLEGAVNKNIGEIIGPLKDTVLSKVLVIA